MRQVLKTKTGSYTKKGRTKNLKAKIRRVLETGFDKPLDSKIWMSNYPEKIFGKCHYRGYGFRRLKQHRAALNGACP